MDCPVAKVLIDRDENSLLGMGDFENRLIARIFWPIANPDHVMTGGTAFFGRLAPYAAVQQELHSGAPAVISSGSIRSLPNWRRA